MAALMRNLVIFVSLFCVFTACEAKGGKYTVDSHGVVTVGCKKCDHSNDADRLDLRKNNINKKIRF